MSFPVAFICLCLVPPKRTILPLKFSNKSANHIDRPNRTGIMRNLESKEGNQLDFIQLPVPCFGFSSPKWWLVTFDSVFVWTAGNRATTFCTFSERIFCFRIKALLAQATTARFKNQVASDGRTG